ncbi:hypothetical protein K491DRAFT_709522 [Lophiostoma macrostomum CBS 122681]|uniref:Uncharacterized protein n=1 Tax=Lophiostoma macrostomum CBS 122681 TaxID=1314788 RepID=A0A6A6TV58_9PLEO|nr:hypothetical protein K491DRAFT_709522 [Lophiostoma macrostomum CBS 122681]
MYLLYISEAIDQDSDPRSDSLPDEEKSPKVIDSPGKNREEPAQDHAPATTHQGNVRPKILNPPASFLPNIPHTTNIPHPISDRNTTTSPLLRLPGELRNQIWSYSFAPTIHFSLFTSTTPSSPVPALHLACRSLYTETGTFLYSGPTFYFAGMSTFKAWVLNRSAAQLGAVTSVRFQARDAHFRDAEYIQKELPGLKKIQVVRCCEAHVRFVREKWEEKGVELEIHDEKAEKGGVW